MDMETGLQKTLKLLKRYEGFRDTVYLDGKGIPTIGYGFTDPALIKKGKITQKEADSRLTKEIATRYNTLKDTLPNFEKLSDDSKAALISYHFNYPAGFKDTTKFMKYWNAGDYEKAIKEVDAGMNDLKNPGLRPRRLEEQAMLSSDPFLSGIIATRKRDGNKILKFPVPEQKPFESTWKPEQPTKTIYPLNNTAPESISSWNGADAPNATPRLKDFQEVRQEDLNRGIDVYGDPVSPFSLRLRLPSLTSLLQLNSPEEQAKQHFADALGISDMLPQTPSLFPKLKDGKVPNDPYERFKYSLPDNQKNTPESEYNTRRYWELNGRPKSFQEAVEREMYDLQADGWHANSVSYNQNTGEYEFMKPRNHPTVHEELEWYNSDDAKEFRKKYKHIQPKNSNFDKYVPRYEDGTIPGLGPKKNIKPKDLQLSTKEERGLETAGPIEKALIAWLGGRAITGGLSMYNRARAFKQAKETYRQARQWNEQTRDASRAWKIADADQIARNSLYSGSSEPLGWLYDTLLRPVINTYDKLNQSPIGIILP